MCHGHPRTHPCSHTSVTWHYCPSALIELDTGYETPCSNTTFAPSQPTTTNCPLQNCQFKDMDGSWTCCACKQGPNTRGWCTMPASRLKRNPDTFEVEAFETTCDHGCCKNCTHFSTSRSLTPDAIYAELRKESRSRGIGYESLARAFPAATRSGASARHSTTSDSSSSLSSSAGSSSGYKINLDYSTTGKNKLSKKNPRGKAQ